MKIDLGSISGTDILKNIIIVTLLVIIFSQRECGKKSPLVNIGVRDTTTKLIHDTVSIPSKPQKAVINYVDTGSTHFVALPLKIDTPAIVRQYLKTYQYIQQFTSKQYNATFNACVSHDSIYAPNLSVKWLAPTETINQITTPPAAENLKVFIGLKIGASPQQFNFGPQIAVLTKTGHLYGISNDLALKQPNAELYVGWKLHL